MAENSGWDLFPFPVVNRAQADELLAGPARTDLPVVVTGDFNSLSDFPTYTDVIAAGFQDAWTHTHPGDPGFTWGQLDLANPKLSLDVRIDYIFSRGAAAEHTSLVGNNPAERTSNGLWPSDHLGVIAALEFGQNEQFDERILTKCSDPPEAIGVSIETVENQSVFECERLPLDAAWSLRQRSRVMLGQILVFP